MNLLVYFAFILGPRNKYELFDVIVDDHYGREHISCGKKDYIKDMLIRRMKTGQSSSSSTSESDKYNGEFCEPFDKKVHFDILQWWKVNTPMLPIISLMARDLLAIPISTVASESAFNTSGPVLDSFWSSLGDKTIECLVCAQDWLRISLNPEKNENMDTIAKIEKGYYCGTIISLSFLLNLYLFYYCQKGCLVYNSTCHELDSFFVQSKGRLVSALWDYFCFNVSETSVERSRGAPSVLCIAAGSSTNVLSSHLQDIIYIGFGRWAKVEPLLARTACLTRLEQPLVLPPPLPAHPPILPPRDAAVGRPALRVITLSGIIHTRENMSNVR
uniref:Zinc finger BED domain-containing protein RICESLEEPER 2-like n=1 Tax=Tanacetum cinerariifolium TaxID=118510 RepID=A0A6L2MH76_TANCI|nr:zinc finger BED domain-containing protein RICESLEEPER 2-like [Tanacetum cinerariifolium]